MNNIDRCHWRFLAISLDAFTSALIPIHLSWEAVLDLVPHIFLFLDTNPFLSLEIFFTIASFSFNIF